MSSRKPHICPGQDAYSDNIGETLSFYHWLIIKLLKTESEGNDNSVMAWWSIEEVLQFRPNQQIHEEFLFFLFQLFMEIYQTTRRPLS